MSGIGMELSTLPAPCIVEELSSDRIFASIWKDFIASYPDFSALLESDPAVKLIEVAAYREMLLRDDIRVLTDTVHVVSAQIIPVHVEADIWLYPESVIEVLEALPEYLSAQCSIAASLGWDCTRSWLISRLHIAGVHRVALAEPAYDVVVEGYQYAHLVGCTLRYAGRGR